MGTPGPRSGNVSTLRGIFLSGGPAWIFVKLTTILFAAIALSRLLPGPDRQVPHYRPRPLLAAAKYVGGTAVVVLLLGACAVAVDHPAAPQATAAEPWAARTVPPDAVGVFVPGDATSVAPTKAFAKATGVTPSIVRHSARRRRSTRNSRGRRSPTARPRSSS